MKKEVRSVEVGTSKSDSEVTNVTCTFLAAKSAFYNYIMALLLEVADCTLNQLQTVTKLIQSITELVQEKV